MTSLRRFAVMCGTPHLSTTIRTSSFGVFSTRVGPWPRVPNTLGLNVLARSPAVTSPSFGVSASYMSAWSVECASGGTFPLCPGFRMLQAESRAA